MNSELWMVWATIAVVLIYYLSTPRRDPCTAGQPPGPRPLPLIGNLLHLRHGHLHHTLARLARVHGPVMRLKLGITTAVIISSRDAVREAFTRHDRRLAARAVPDATRALGSSERSMVWLPSSNPLWKTQRGLVTSHLFTPRGFAAVRGVRERKVRELLGYFRDRAGREVDVGQGVYGGVLNLVSSAVCSVDVVDAGAESATGLRTTVEDLAELITKPNVSDLFPFLRPLDLQGRRRFAAKHLEKIFSILGGIVDRRAEETRTSSSNNSRLQNNDFLDTLIDLMSTGKMARDNVTAILFDVFTAGSDTIAVTVEWAMAELLRNPTIMSKACAEIKGVLGYNETVGEKDVAGLPYLQAVVKEAIRLHPVAPIMLPHKAVEDGVEVGGYAVPKGATVIFNVWAIMRDPAIWERPDEFVPERWFLNGAADMDFRGKDFEFIRSGPAGGCVPACRWRSASCRTYWRRCCTRSSGDCRTACRPSSWIEGEVHHRQRHGCPTQGCARRD
ncbi:hypothetical protein PR202_gb02952 [Eleusine coracana subsp. coracana]|uniref:Uncharacterized protein n=1 Tax=Eleusine coracana subsp. coracana TaxID=191504 RepID=A0AAV5E0K8_ELECO|nr:hypothetical protein QOZ80_8BG0662830 [Eleusine coracana subsp. coracana]GJN16002.1 hypothetical protein PR202_gb02952 [Eleusine coracana subsp. coracana]